MITRLAMILPGLGRVQRGAETAFLELARSLGRFPDVQVELFGSGDDGPEGIPLHRVGCIPRERFEGWPRLPCLRGETHYEEFTFLLGLMAARAYDPSRFDAVIACTYPFVNWFLQKSGGRRRPKQVFVTQNGDWMCFASSREFRLFRCDGLVCINPSYHESHRRRYPSALIPNGVDPDVFRPREAGDEAFDPRIPSDRPVVLMVSALIPSKRVDQGILAASKVPDAFLVVAGDGPERAKVASLAETLLPGRHLLLGSVPRAKMPGLFRSADAFLHASREEPFGIVYLEAAASALPIVAPDVEVPRWVLGGSAEFFADTEAASEALRRALDPQIGQALGASARRRVLADWTWDAQAARYRAFIGTILKGEGRPDRPAMAEQ